MNEVWNIYSREAPEGERTLVIVREEREPLPEGFYFVREALSSEVVEERARRLRAQNGPIQ